MSLIIKPRLSRSFIWLEIVSGGLVYFIFKKRKPTDLSIPFGIGLAGIVTFKITFLGVELSSFTGILIKFIGHEEIMNTENLNVELELEYDLSKLKVRKVGVGRKILQGNQITLDVDVAKVFPDFEPVNQVLRLLIRVTKEHQPELK